MLQPSGTGVVDVLVQTGGRTPCLKRSGQRAMAQRQRPAEEDTQLRRVSISRARATAAGQRNGKGKPPATCGPVRVHNASAHRKYRNSPSSTRCPPVHAPR